MKQIKYDRFPPRSVEEWVESMLDGSKQTSAAHEPTYRSELTAYVESILMQGREEMHVRVAVLEAALREIAEVARHRDSGKSLESDAMDSCYEIDRIARRALADEEGNNNG